MKKYPATARDGLGGLGAHSSEAEKSIVCPVYLKVCSKQTTFENKAII
jgi:hypothetical protein